MRNGLKEKINKVSLFGIVLMILGSFILATNN